MAKTLIVDYGAGNLRSVLNSLKHVGAGDDVALTSDPDAIKSADRVILPGVGAFHECKRGLTALDGMIEALGAHKDAGKPFLGICVGMQLLVEEGDEHGIATKGLGWIKGKIERISPQNRDAKIPHMGWNTLNVTQNHPILSEVDGQDVYFVHSYSAQGTPAEQVYATTDYYGSITAAIGHENVIGVQFHPEKSQNAGLNLLQRFLSWKP